MKSKNITQLTILFVMILSSFSIFTQTLEKGTWWLHPIWGAGDQSGASNWITPEKIVEALQMVQSGKVYELGQIYEAEMPLFGARSYNLKTTPNAPSGGPIGNNKLVFNEEHLSTEIGQVGTQFDGPGHVGTQIKFVDGKVEMSITTALQEKICTAQMDCESLVWKISSSLSLKEC